MIQNPLILNRDSSGVFRKPADGWYQIAPLGEFSHATGITQVIDSKAAELIVNRFNQEAAQPNFAGLLVDFDHFSYESTQSSQAAGWITELANRDTGIWAKIRWTATGDQAISNGEFRFVSPTWLRADMEQVDKAINRMRPTRLDSVGLTNTPQIKGMAPLSNRQGDEPTKQQQPTKKVMKSIATFLGLTPEAEEASVLQSVQAIKNRTTELDAALKTITSKAADEVKAAQDALTPIKNRVTELEAANAELSAIVVESDLNKYSARFKPESRDMWKGQLIANRASALALLESFPEAQAKGADGKPILNRADGKTPAAETPKTFTQIVANRMANNTANLPKSAVIQACRTENPDAFQAWHDAGGGPL